MPISLETLKISFALDIKLFGESVSRDIGTEGNALIFNRETQFQFPDPLNRILNISARAKLRHHFVDES